MSIFSKEQQKNAAQKRIGEMERRLENGWEMTNGLDATHPHVVHLLNLLKEYEKACFTYKTLGGELK